MNVFIAVTFFLALLSCQAVLADGDNKGARLIKVGNTLDNYAQILSPRAAKAREPKKSPTNPIRSQLYKLKQEKMVKNQQRKKSIIAGATVIKNLMKTTQSVKMDEKDHIVEVDPKAVGRVVLSMKRRIGVVTDSFETRKMAASNGFNQYQSVGHGSCDALNIMMRVSQFERTRSAQRPNRTRTKRLSIMTAKPSTSQDLDLSWFDQFLNGWTDEDWDGGPTTQTFMGGQDLEPNDLSLLAYHMSNPDCTYSYCAYTGDEMQACNNDLENLINFDPQISAWIQFMMGYKVEPHQPYSELNREQSNGYYMHKMSELLEAKLKSGAWRAAPQSCAIIVLAALAADLWAH